MFDVRFERLKTELFCCGRNFIEDFIGYDIPHDEDKDLIELRLNEAYTQMPQEELEKYYRKYNIT